MTSTQSTRLPAHIYYANMADEQERDPIQGGTVTRATVPMGRGFALWRRINPGLDLVYVDDAEGRPRALTPKQYAVLSLALEMIEGTGMTMRDMALVLEVAPSTVSRALTKLVAWGLIAYLVGRGRYAGLVIFRRAKDDGFDRLRKAAKQRVWRWSQYAASRISRLKINVASIYSLKEIEASGYLSVYGYVMDATLTEQLIAMERDDPWQFEPGA